MTDSDRQTATHHGAAEAAVFNQEPGADSGGARAARMGGLLAAWGRATFDNPVLVKEFRTRMRGTRAYWMLLGYTLLLAGVLAIMYFNHEVTAASQADSAYGTAGAAGARELGRWMYGFVFVAQALMVALITPAITSGTVTIEREQRSYELLVTTPLRPSDLIRGKLSAAVSFVVLLLTASLPLVSLSFLVGGVSPGEIFFSYLIVALSAFVYGALGIFWSATLRTTAAATVVTYLSVLSLFVLTVIPGAIGSGSGEPSVPFQSLNPLMATFRAVEPEYLFEAKIPSWVGASVLSMLLGLLVSTAAMSRLEHFDPPRPLWMRLWSTLLWCAFGLFLFGPILGGVGRSWTNPGSAREGVDYMMRAMLVLLVLVVPVFNTGDLIIRRGESAIGRYLGGLLPHRMFRNDLSAGFPLVILWSLFFFSLLPLGAALLGKMHLFPMDVYVPGVLLCLSVIIGLAGVGNFLSVTLPSRWAACVLTYLVAVVLMLLPYFTMFWWYQLPVKPRSPQIVWQVLYFVPFEGLWQLATPQSYRTDHPAMMFGSGVHVWAVTSVIYLAIGFACFLFTAARVNQQGKQLQQRMEAVEKTLQSAPA